MNCLNWANPYIGVYGTKDAALKAMNEAFDLQHSDGLFDLIELDEIDRSNPEEILEALNQSPCHFYYRDDVSISSNQPHIGGQPMTALLKEHEATCGPGRTDLLVDTLGSNPTVLAWAMRNDIENRRGN